MTTAAGRAKTLFRSTAGQSPPASSNRNFSDMRRAPSPVPYRREKAISKARTKALFFSTRSARCLSKPRSSSCASSKQVNSSGSELQRRSQQTRESLQPQTERCIRRSLRKISVKISTTVCAASSCRFLRSGNGAGISCFWRNTSSMSSSANTRSPSKASAPNQPISCSDIHGRATYAN